MVVTSDARDVEGCVLQGTHCFVVTFDGRKVQQPNLKKFAWNPKACDSHMSDFLASCKYNKVKVQPKAHGHQPISEDWTRGCYLVGYMCILAHTDEWTSPSAIVMPPKAHDFIGQVQACLREVATAVYDAVHEILTGVPNTFFFGQGQHQTLAC